MFGTIWCLSLLEKKWECHHFSSMSTVVWSVFSVFIWKSVVERWKRLGRWVGVGRNQGGCHVTEVLFHIQTKDILETRLASEPTEPRGCLSTSLWRLHLTWRLLLQGKMESVYQKDKSDVVVKTYFDKQSIHVKVLQRLDMSWMSFSYCVSIWSRLKCSRVCFWSFYNS